MPLPIHSARAIARKQGLDLVKVNKVEGPGAQYRLVGAALEVDWWPLSKKRTAYIPTTHQGRPHVDIHALISMGKGAPPIVPKAERPKRNSTKARRWRWNRFQEAAIRKCYWCQTPINYRNSTVDHKIPLMRGGLDNPSNFVLSCKPCNEQRGHDMPELGK